jgi:hypothetical protein
MPIPLDRRAHGSGTGSALRHVGSNDRSCPALLSNRGTGLFGSLALLIDAHNPRAFSSEEDGGCESEVDGRLALEKW